MTVIDLNVCIGLSCPVCLSGWLAVFLVAVVSNEATVGVSGMSLGSDAPCGSRAEKEAERCTRGDDGSWASST